MGLCIERRVRAVIISRYKEGRPSRLKIAFLKPLANTLMRLHVATSTPHKRSGTAALSRLGLDLVR